MSIEQNIFKRYSPDYNKLKEFGFKKEKDCYYYEKLFKNDEFRAIIAITEDGYISSTVYDELNNDEYLPLKIENSKGGFVGEVRSEYEKILYSIRDNCFNKHFFITEQANRITDFIYREYKDAPQFLWEKYTGIGVFKNPQNDKWYGLISNIEFSKLDKNKQGETEIINIKLEENKIQQLLEENGYYPAWHMNKRSWITIVLNNTIQDEKLIKLIKESHKYTENKHRNWIIPANPKFYDIENAFKTEKEIIWKQSSDINAGDTAYMYVAAPVSAILYKCEVTAVNIPYKYKDKNIEISRVMKIKLLKKYDRNYITFNKLKEHNINAVRGQRNCPDSLVKIL